MHTLRFQYILFYISRHLKIFLIMRARHICINLVNHVLYKASSFTFIKNTGSRTLPIVNYPPPPLTSKIIPCLYSMWLINRFLFAIPTRQM